MATRAVPQLLDLSGKAAIVTGGAMGIGQATALRLAEAGAAVMISDIDLGAAGETSKEIRAKGRKSAVIQADAASVADAARVVEATVKAFGTIDILVNNAGIFPISPALETSERIWDKVLDVNLKGAFFYSQAAAARMIGAKRAGRIINIASIDSLHPSGSLAHYDASKGGLWMMTKSLAVEFAPHGIAVNAIAPGVIRTPGADKALEGADPKAFISRIPLGRLGEPDDIARVALFLAGPAADYMTGSLVVVDGGYLVS